MICLNCGVEKVVEKKHKIEQRFCSRQCFQDYRQKTTVENGEGKHRSCRKYLLKKFGNVCSVCGISEWNGKQITLELEHRDGDSSNNKLDNLSMMCPNCHSQTETFKSKNKGNGRYYRRQRHQEGKSY